MDPRDGEPGLDELHGTIERIVARLRFAEVRAGLLHSARERRAEARGIREALLEEIPREVEAERRDNDWDPEEKWWLPATIAEANLGLGRLQEAREALERAMGIAEVSDWERESTARQLARLTWLRLSAPKESDAKSQETLDAYTEAMLPLAPHPDQKAHAMKVAGSLLSGKVGLALSGGGFRASLFHIGVLARLAELDVLRRVEVLSCVSGGSILGAHYYLEIMLPGAILGAVVGFATQRYGKGRLASSEQVA